MSDLDVTAPDPTPPTSDATILANMDWPCTDSELIVRLGLTPTDRLKVRHLLREAGATLQGGSVATSIYIVDYPTAVWIQEEFGIVILGPAPPAVELT